MKSRYCGRRGFEAIGLILIWGVNVSACAATTFTWKEEVMLHDGQKIIVTRTVERGGKSEIGQQAPIKRQSLSLTLPVTNENVVWEDNFAQDIEGASFLPLQLEVNQGSPYIVAYPMGCLAYNKWGRPNPPYVVFKYQSKKWQRIALQELPAALKVPNLIFSSPDTEARKSGPVVSAEAIKTLNSGHTLPEHKTILRESIKSGTFQSLVSCDDLVFYKDVWVGSGDSIGKRMMDRKTK